MKLRKLTDLPPQANKVFTIRYHSGYRRAITPILQFDGSYKIAIVDYNSTRID
jgi:hypothetical protein